MDLFFLSWTLQYQLFFVFGFVIILIVVVAYINRWFQARKIRRYYKINGVPTATTGQRLSHKTHQAVPSTADELVPAIEVNGVAIDEVDQTEAEDRGQREPLFGTHALQAGQFVRNVTTIRDSIPGFNLTIEEIIAAQEVVNRPIPVARQPSNPKGKGKLAPKPPRIHSVELSDPPTLSEAGPSTYKRENLPSQARRPQTTYQPYTRETLSRANATRERPFSTGDLADEVVTSQLPHDTSGTLQSSASSAESRPDSGYDSSLKSAAEESLTSAEGDSGNDILSMLDNHRASIVRETGNLNTLRDIPHTYVPRREPYTRHLLDSRKHMSDTLDSVSTSTLLNPLGSDTAASHSSTSDALRGSYTFVETYKPEVPLARFPTLRSYDSNETFQTALSALSIPERPTSPMNVLDDHAAAMPLMNTSERMVETTNKGITVATEFRVVNKNFAVGHGRRFSHLKEENMELVPIASKAESAKRRSVFDVFRGPSRRKTADPEMGLQRAKLTKRSSA